eukprot:gene18025-20534_t
MSEVVVTLTLTKDLVVSGNFAGSTSTSSILRTLRSLLDDDEKVRKFDLLMHHPGRIYTHSARKFNDKLVMMEQPFTSTLTKTILKEIGFKAKELNLKYLIPIELFNRGTGVGSTTNKKLLKKDVFDPQFDFDEWIMTMVGTDMMAVTENDLPVTAAIFESLILSKNEEDTLTFFKAPFVANYSDVAVPVVFDAVIAEQITSPPAAPAVSVLCVSEAGGSILNKFLRHGSHLLLTRIASVEDSFATDIKFANFEANVDFLVQKLEQVNRVYAPRNNHNETAHRLVIHEVVNSACDILRTVWLAEESVYTYKQRGKLGYGPLDVYFPGAGPLLMHESLEEVDQQQTLPQDDDGKGPTTEELVDLEAQGTELSPNRKRPATALGDEMALEEHLRSLEAKVLLDDRALAQTVAQMVDLTAHHRAKISVPAELPVCVNGILCTAHRWLYFSVTDPGDGKKPALEYHGEVNMRVLRKNIKIGDLEMATPGGRRPSHCGKDENKLDRTAVRNVLLALVAFMKPL